MNLAEHSTILNPMPFCWFGKAAFIILFLFGWCTVFKVAHPWNTNVVWSHFRIVNSNRVNTFMLSNNEKTHFVLCENFVSTDATYITQTPQTQDGWFLWCRVDNTVFSCWLKVCYVFSCKNRVPKVAWCLNKSQFHPLQSGSNNMSCENSAETLLNYDSCWQANGQTRSKRQHCIFVFYHLSGGSWRDVLTDGNTNSSCKLSTQHAVLFH